MLNDYNSSRVFDLAGGGGSPREEALFFFYN